jgi:hypothetical protein
MGLFYQTDDNHILDYAMENLHGEWFRGPLTAGPESIAWLGAAQTFGRYVPEPFPHLVGQRLQMGTLNLGSGGKGPKYFLDRPELLREANRCRLAVVQVMSARASNNAAFRSRIGGDSGVRVSDGQAIKGLALMYEFLNAGRRREAVALLRESQRNFVHENNALIDALHVPTVQLFISYEPPAPTYTRFRNRMTVFPQWVDQRVVRQIKGAADAWVEVVSREGIPQQVVDKSGQQAVANGYYPSPEMHRIAADRLVPIVAGILGRAT